MSVYLIAIYFFCFVLEEKLSTWKLSNNLDEILSSNCFIVSQGPSPTPTRTMDNGSSLQQFKQKRVKVIY